MTDLKEAVKKTLVGQKAQWAMVLSEWGVYLPHQTDGYLLFCRLLLCMWSNLYLFVGNDFLKMILQLYPCNTMRIFYVFVFLYDTY